jgi:D-alanyl-D-alanine carboxypeptidase
MRRAPWKLLASFLAAQLFASLAACETGKVGASDDLRATADDARAMQATPIVPRPTKVATPEAFPSEVPSAPAERELTPAQQALAKRLDAAAHWGRADVIGLAVKVVSRGTTLLERGYGFMDLAVEQALPADAIFRIGSITKQFTAAAILQLEERGKLKLNDPVGKYLREPYLKDPSKPIAQVTLQQLLTHTAGIRNYVDSPWFEGSRGEAHPLSDVVGVFADLPLDFEPGTRFFYSNSGYYLLGLVVEQVSGHRYPEYLRQYVFAPAGLVDTRYCPDAQDYPRATPGYEHMGQLRPAVPIAMTSVFASGGLCSSTSDLVRWTQALSSGKVIQPESFARMRSETILKGGQRSLYGFGLFLDDLEGHPRLHHGGRIDGFASQLSYYPDADLYIAVLANTGSPVPDRVSEQLAQIVLGTP